MLTKRGALAFFLATLCVPATAEPSLSQALAPPRPVTTGAEALAASGFAALAGKRVGLITNQTGRVGAEHLADLLSKAPRREAHRDLRPRARLPRQGRGRSERAQRRRRQDRRSHLQPLRRHQEADAGHAAQRGCAGVRHPGCRRPLLHLHLDHGPRHAGGGRGAHPLRRARPAQSARRRVRLGVRAGAGLALLRRPVPDPDRARPDRRRAGTHDQGREAGSTASTLST